MAGVHQAALQLKVVLNYAVVDHRDALLTVGMGMGVLVGWAAVGGPAGMTQPNGAVGVGSSAVTVQTVYLANGLTQLNVAVRIYDGDTGAVVAPVLKPPQPLIDDGPGFLPPNISNDAAHSPSRPLSTCRASGIR